MRLNDEKRSVIKVGDKIEFENIVSHQKMKCSVIDLRRYRNFFELYDNYEKSLLGYEEKQLANAEDMYTYYSPEQINLYGVVAIVIKIT